MIQRRDAEETVVLGLSVVSRLDSAGVDEALVIVEYSLGESRRSRREVYSGIVRLLERTLGVVARALGGKVVIVLCKGGAGSTEVDERASLSQLVGDCLDTSYEFVAEYENVRLGKLETVIYLVRGITEVERDCKRASLEYSEIYRQPIDTVHEKYRYLLALSYTVGDKHIGESVCLFVEDLPRDLASVMTGTRRLDELKLVPGEASGLGLLGIDLDERRILCVFTRVSFQQMNYGHDVFAPK